ncbi:DUF4270 domain-containing protein [Winogradskyella haliclonae]|uniref:DUF4270 domain-containing protein n=1 Tax=Winogradskyella haliclonae TaxID=2048558 RepID=A0ABQ2BXI5_9FLAO|nr:DUF4270 domain-containing protein [Winogradskyella haliclonae]GGI56497.1 hypothetical protein GCM10011444_08060 [Winogradskyella haliclonae]
MKLYKKNLRNILVFGFMTCLFIACDEEFSTIDSDIINEETATNFNTTSEKFDVISYTDKLDPVQTSGLGINMLGVFNDPTYGQTIASFLTQVNTTLVDPSFGSNVILDSVVLSIPFFSRNIGLDEDNNIAYEIDSILPRDDIYNPIKLSLYENNYFLRDFDPNEEFDVGQSYFSNKSASANELISISDLEFTLIDEIETLEISNQEILLTDGDETEPTINQRLSPRIRIVWDKNIPDDSNVINYWTEKIINQEGESTLSNINNFNDYFRGLYFKAEPINNNGSLMLLNLAQEDANITLFYSFDSTSVDGERDNSTYVLTFNPTRVNFFENNYTLPFSDGNQDDGDSRLYLKGGQGALAGIKLFNGENSDNDNTNDNTFETWRKQFVNLDENGDFESSKRLINEANLVFYVDQTLVEQGEEPERLYIYNKTNRGPLFDYFEDVQNNTSPSQSIINHLGVLIRDQNTERGIRYKMTITTHINNLLINNSENVELGIAVSGNVNLEGSIPQYRVQTSNGETETVPVSSVISPRGTVLHGSNSEIEDKRLFLEIFYTCLETDIDCPNN